MFGIDWALLAGLGGFVAAIVIGGPLTRALAEPGELRARARRPKAPERARTVVTAGFEPLDLGEDPMQWPSQRPWPPGMDTPPWPSQTWDDEHFGSFWRSEKAPANPPGSEESHRVMEPRTSSPRPAPSTLRAARRTAEPPPRAATGQAPSPSPRTAERRAARLPAVSPPPRAELEQLISSIGLAGTVQNIMQRTGWDFRKAAHYLAKIRQQS